jgi:hypothetical protein
MIWVIRLVQFVTEVDYKHSLRLPGQVFHDLLQAAFACLGFLRFNDGRCVFFFGRVAKRFPSGFAPEPSFGSDTAAAI